MGKKTNPLGFRLGTTQNHYSIWFAQPKNYSKGLQEDQKIRNFIQNYVQNNQEIFLVQDSRFGGWISHIEIQKEIDVIQVRIYMGFRKSCFSTKKERKKLEELQTHIEEELYSIINQKLNIHIRKVGRPYMYATFLTEFLVRQLKRRVSFRKALQKIIDLTRKVNIKGIRIQIAGRLYGKEIARARGIREGRIPRQTVRAKLDYCFYKHQTIHGVLGIKIWLFVGEE